MTIGPSRENARTNVLRHPPRRRTVARVERGLPAADLPPREHDLAAGRAQQRLGVGDRLREGEVAETGREELDGGHCRNSTSQASRR